ncbi:MAG TPA: hypothetical protein VGS28_03780 [Candidatus Saccharimonadales bacterium]|nr:hypothetical protein [Candidatus Saccharimonadales bacterium]
MLPDYLHSIFGESVLRKISFRWSFLIGSWIVLFGSVVFVMNSLNPNNLGPDGILLFFALMYLTILVTVVILMRLTIKFTRFGGRAGWKPTRAKRIYLSSIIALAPVMLIALNTLGQLETLDIILVAVFEVIALFYIQRRT